jgi:hypothetical protein
MGGHDRGVTRRDRYQMQVRYDVAGGVQSSNRGSLMLVDLTQPTSVVSAPKAEARSERTSQPIAG